MLSVITLLIVASCKKESSKEEKVTCQMTSVTVELISSEYTSSSTKNYTYDDKGRITKMKDDLGNEMSYSYSSNQIIEESPLIGFNSNYYKGVYKLDASGKIISALKTRSLDGETENSIVKYLYDSDGYLSEIQETSKDVPVFYYYSYTNGNLTSIKRTGSADTRTRFTKILYYAKDLAPSDFFANYKREILNTGLLKAYFGKASKNLISVIEEIGSLANYGPSLPSLWVSYDYKKNAEGNVSQMIENGEIGGIPLTINEFNFNCK